MIPFALWRPGRLCTILKIVKKRSDGKTDIILPGSSVEMLEFKKGVRITGVRPEIVLAIQVVEGCFHFFEGTYCVVTSVCEGKHSRTSLHHSGAAVDFRIKHIGGDEPELTIECIVEDIRAALTDEFDVVLEKTHIHVEFQPKEGYP